MSVAKVRLCEVVAANLGPDDTEDFLTASPADVGKRWPAIQAKIESEAARRHCTAEQMYQSARVFVERGFVEVKEAAADALEVAKDTLAEVKAKATKAKGKK